MSVLEFLLNVLTTRDTHKLTNKQHTPRTGHKHTEKMLLKDRLHLYDHLGASKTELRLRRYGVYKLKGVNIITLKRTGTKL